MSFKIVEMSAKSALRHDRAWGVYLDLDLVVNVFLRHVGDICKVFVKWLERSLGEYWIFCLLKL